MNNIKNKIRLAFASVLLSALLPVTAFAMPTFVGSYQVDDGAYWIYNPDVFSGIDAAALLFGGMSEDYRISTNSSMDFNTITDTAWYSIVGVSGGHEYDDDYMLDLTEDGYAANGWITGGDISAFVRDNAQGANYTNYVWLDSAATVSEPSSLALIGLGMIGLGAARRRKEK